ncbi:MAG: hypothetical protein B1H11_10625 [Desulfobacteraceae bacterium 4484_190.1]|nr:MAG: hypothetical protein B1H11_10625 [Desulfobacteraceae bacterium 4484_190.1]
MREADVTTCNIEKSNWLMRSLVFISLGVHALVLMQMAGVYKPKTASFIELEMRTDEKYFGRDIPVPPQRKKMMPQLHAQPIKPISPMPIVKPVTPAVVEPIAALQKPDLSKSKLLPWLSSLDTPGSKTVPEGASSAYGSPADYFSMVRMMIESHKQYPYAARKRQIQGRVVVRFVIGADGTVSDISLVESSRHRLLDEAALAAVKTSSPFPKPPLRLFTGPIPLELCIVFELR